MVKDEVWKDIPGYEGIYQASNLGRIRTKPGKVTYTERHGIRHWKTRILKGRGNNPTTGKRVSLWKDGKAKDWLVARLVGMTFLGIPEKGMTINHKDGNRFNNNVENLEWLSLADNVRHAFKTGLMPTNRRIKLKSSKGFIYECNSYAEASRLLGRYEGYICNQIKKGKTIAVSKKNNEVYLIIN